MKLQKPRIIYNDDTISLRNIPQPHTIDKINYAVDYLKGTQVDILCWSMTACDIAYSWKSKVLESIYDDKKNVVPDLRGEVDLTKTLYADGTDYLPHLITRARENGLKFFPSFRMNDCHHKGEPDGAGASRFWKEHQQYRLWEVADASTFFNAALDYSYAEVRDRKFRAIVEVCENYDVDGIEIDFNRDPYVFPPSTAWSQRNVLTAYFKKIRNAVDRIAKKRGREIALLIRVPFSQQMLMTGGMDVEAWIRLGLMDILVMCCRSPEFSGGNDYNQKVEPWLTRCRKNHVLFYPSLEVCIALNPRADLHIPTTLTSYDWAGVHTKFTRAAAQNFLAQGVDGIYMFNYPCALFERQNNYLENRPKFNKLAEVLYQVGSENTLKRTSKLYCFFADLPILVEANRPPQYHQTIKFNISDPDLRTKNTRVILRFRQEAKKNPHAYVNYEPKPVISPRTLKYYLNGWEIPSKLLKKKRQPSGAISGFRLNEHELVQITLPASKFKNGENKLAFHIPHFPKSEDPYIYIYDLGAETVIR